MVFSSTEFLCFFLPIVLMLYYLCRRNRTLSNVVLTVMSLLFYAWGEPTFVLVMLASIFINWLAARVIDGNRERPRARKLALIAGLVLDVGMLAVFKYLSFFVQGLEYTLLLSIISVGLAVIPALALALMRLSRNKIVRNLSGAYIAVFRSTPMMVQLYIIFYGLFSVIKIPSVVILGFIDLSRFIPGVVALALNSSAYVAEIIRAGILAVDGGQNEAARSLGLSSWQSMKLVVLPQAIKNILPALANELVTMVKESSICSVLGMTELIWGAKTVATTTYKTLSPYVLAALVYFVINYPAGKAIEAIERRMRRGDRI